MHATHVLLQPLVTLLLFTLRTRANYFISAHSNTVNGPMSVGRGQTTSASYAITEDLNNNNSSSSSSSPPLEGTSIKICRNLSHPNEITQLEFEILHGRLYYDISSIDGHPFKEHGLRLTPSAAECGGCRL
ncbi:hypothetical protein AJ80_06850 [Polytolypa hystricis UAMH7299]|uniref:Uncharacterized protein n=1 Tax=Polytolypa hystricis (strain UAMH7299) TaxID=1447883 RepID=A0A2B7XT37_POLH7|nr:hypothetical protein AJ80_06850 [Polytolypa hystricis UAMH7299]